MEVKRGWFYWLISGSVIMLLALGTWWLYLVFKLSNKLSNLNHPALEGNLLSMVKWEGATFILFLFVLTGTLLYVYVLDLKKTKALQAFFASLTHELKTPLASMKLQTEVLEDSISHSGLSDSDKEKIQTYTQRLLNDSVNLEDQLDNHLQLSRVERDSPLNLRIIELDEFIQKESHRNPKLPQVKIKNKAKENLILADDYALQTILRNLFENSCLHHPLLKEIEIDIQDQGENLLMIYKDFSPAFQGDVDKLSHLFFKHNSPKGSGIGLYLIKRLMHKMGGKLLITNDTELVFSLVFKRGHV